MLLKKPEPELADSQIPMVSPEPTQDATADAPRADLLDDVFGSDSSGADDNADAPILQGDEDHPSDMRRLQQEHTTAGYRDGVTVAKASSVQAGFDEGFGLGATIGLAVGRLLGLLEGIAGALAKGPAGAHRERATGLLAEARGELVLGKVFCEEFWNSDGTWKYEVVGSDGKEGDDDEAVLFSHVAEAHPLVRKWTAVVEDEMQRWGLEEKLSLLARPEDGDEPVAEPMARAKATPVQSQQSEAKAPNEALSW